jgi:hypothetical protein
VGRPRTFGKTSSARLHVEELESRLVPTVLAPSPLDQLMLQELNAIRANPAAYGQSIGVNLANVAPSQPLAWDPRLVAAAQQHSQNMNDLNYFAHTDLSGLDPGQRMTAAGYSWVSWGESIAAGYADPASALAALITDAGVPDLGHRIQLLAETAMFQNQSQVGIGIVLGGSGTYQDYYTIDTAAPANPLPFLTGVVFGDTNSNGRYDQGEGLGGVTITVAGVGSTTTWASGGYEMQLNPGTYQVTASGGGLAFPQMYQVTISSQNVELDVVKGQSSSYQQTVVSWIQGIYSSYLERAATTTEVNTLFSQISQGTATSASILAGIRQSAEYRQVNTVWLTQMGKDALGRTLLPAEINAWDNYLAVTGTRATVAQIFESCAAAQSYQLTPWVQTTYQTFLQRTPSGAELNAVLTALESGTTQAQVILAIVSGAEFQSRFGQTNSSYIQALYNGLFGRAASSAEVTYWLNVFQTGRTRASIAWALLNCAAYRGTQAQTQVTQMFSTYLGRTPTTTELTQYSSLWLGGSTPVSMEALITSTAEYYQRALTNY